LGLEVVRTNPTYLLKVCHINKEQEMSTLLQHKTFEAIAKRDSRIHRGRFKDSSKVANNHYQFRSGMILQGRRLRH
jgi:hypothetical protein